MPRSKRLLCIAMVFLAFAPGTASAQSDSSFSVMINTGLSFTHANDPHINKWLAKYHYPTEPHTPCSFNIEVSAMPVASRLMYSVGLSTIVSANNLTSYTVAGGLYSAFVKRKNFILLAGAAAGFHKDIIRLNGDMPADYKALAIQYNKVLCLHRGGLFIEPAMRMFWFPLSADRWQLGINAGLGIDIDVNTPWKLGYYDGNHGEYGRFRKIKKPADQEKVSEHGLAFGTGLSFRLNLY